MIKAPTIMKQNPLIMAEFEKAFSEVDHDVVNILLHSLQNKLLLDDKNIDLFTYRDIFDRKVLIKADTFKELGNFGKNANDYLFESLKKISDTSAVIHNFTDKEGRRVKKKNIRIIDSVAFIKEGATQDKRESVFEVQFNDWFLEISTKQFNAQVGNYTSLMVGDISSLKGKNAKRLYEILKSQKYKNKTFALKLSNLQKLFQMEDKPLSKIVATIKISKNKVHDLMPFEYEVFKADKLISFKLL